MVGEMKARQMGRKGMGAARSAGGRVVGAAQGASSAVQGGVAEGARKVNKARKAAGQKMQVVGERITDNSMGAKTERGARARKRVGRGMSAAGRRFGR
jgi:hypothetical protein